MRKPFGQIILKIFANNINMDILIYVIIGTINGLFSSGAGQILMFYLIYILKQDTKKSREFSLTLMPLISVPTFIFYYTKSITDIKTIIFLIIISLSFGFLGNKAMKKINPILLNLMSGIFLVIITSISLWRTL